MLKGNGTLEHLRTVTHVENLCGDTNVLAMTQAGEPVTVRLFGQHSIAPDQVIGLE